MSALQRLKAKLRRPHASFWHDDRGATAVEFAMVSPLFLLMIGVILETGLMLFTEYVLQTSVQEAARLVRTGQAQEQGMNDTAFKNELCKLAGLIINCQSKVNVYLASAANFQTLKTNTPAFTAIGPQDNGDPGAASFNCGQPSQAVALIATYDWEFSIPYFMSFFGNIRGGDARRLAGFAMFQNEPFPAGGSCA